MERHIKVMRNLEMFGLGSYVGPRILKHLVKIDSYLEETEIRSRISISNLAKGAGIARGTFYKNPILKKYADCYLATMADDKCNTEKAPGSE